MGYTYTIEYNVDLVSAWTDSGLGVFPASGGPNTSTAVNISGTQKFYRVRAFQTSLLHP